MILSAFAKATDVNRAAVAVRPGLVAALPVAGMLALGTAINQPVGAVTMGTGALFTGVAWRSAEGPLTPPLSTMSVAAVMLAVSTLVGTVTGRWPWLHLAVLFCFCLLAGTATAIGRRGGVVGVQTLIAFIVFGRFPESLVGGLRLAGLVLAGGVAQTLFAALVAAPLAWRHQRRVLASAYEQLARVAAEVTGSTVLAAESLDEAERTLAAPVLFGDQQLSGLLNLVSGGRRIRLELMVADTALAAARRERPELAAAVEPELSDALERLGGVLALIAKTIAGADPAALEQAVHDLHHWSDARAPYEPPLLEARISALGGQVRAAARQTLAVSERGSAAIWGLAVLGRPSAGERLGVRGVISDLRRMRESANLSSPAGRHALRLAVVVAGTELLTQRLDLPRGYWAVVAAATVLRPNFGATFTRGAERVLGTAIGVLLATLLADALDPSGWAIVALVGVLAFATFTVFPASFAAGMVTLTAVVVFLLHGQAPDAGTVALDRGLDTIVGGAIGMCAYMLWPTWSAGALPRYLATLLAAQRAYLAAVLSALLTGTRPQPATVMPLARQARVVFGDVEASLTVARGEPSHQGERLSTDQAGAELAALRRVATAIHALRLSAEDEADAGAGGEARAEGGAADAGEPGAEPARRPQPQLAPLATALNSALEALTKRLGQHPEPAPLPPLRKLYRASAGELPESIRPILDELVDAIDSAAAALDR